jgi:hypothetical protein
MSVMRALLIVTLVSLVWTTPARAQPESQTGSAAEPVPGAPPAGATAAETPTAPAEPVAAEVTDATLTPTKVDAASCAPLDLRRRRSMPRRAHRSTSRPVRC